MTRYYTNEKGKFGGTTGTIIPFTIQLPANNFPNFGDFKTYVPAGYLRCNGAVVLASLYPGLADVLGVGGSSTFSKDPDLPEQFFQLPDLGSKYIRTSISSGQYFDNLVTTSDTELFRVGAQVQANSLVGNDLTISYDGEFVVAASDPIPFNGNPLFEATQNDGKTQEDFLTEENFQAHGHTANAGYFTYLGNWADTNWISNGGSGGNNGSNEGSNNLVQIDPPLGAEPAPGHTHGINLPKAAELKQNQSFVYQYQDTSIEPQGLITEVTLTTENVQKLDDAISPYIFVEYLIKI